MSLSLKVLETSELDYRHQKERIVLSIVRNKRVKCEGLMPGPSATISHLLNISHIKYVTKALKNHQKQTNEVN